MKNNFSNLLTVLGVLFIFAAVLLTGYNVVDSNNAAKSAVDIVQQLQEELRQIKNTQEDKNAFPLSTLDTQLPAYVLNPEMELPVKTINGYDCVGIIEIPDLELSLPVIGDLTSAALKVSPCRYFGSPYTDNLIIAAHNYISHFKYIKNLNPGAEIIFTDMSGNEFHYAVACIESLKPAAVEEMQSGEWPLTLFTCTYGGASRITVRCEKMPLE